MARDKDGKMPFNSGAWVLVIETMKLIISLGLAYGEGSLATLKWDKNTWQSAVPAVVYCIDNNMMPYIMSLIDPATVSALFNLKIVTSALLMRCVLGRSLSNAQMVAVVQVAIGSALTQESCIAANAAAAPKDVVQYDPASMTFGSLLVVFTCFMSAFAGVLSEKLLKGGGGDDSMHVANIKLYAFGVLVNGGLAFGKQAAFSPSAPLAIFDGFNTYATMTAMGSALTGLMTAVVLRYFDIIVKSIAASVSMITVYMASIVFIGKPVTIQFTLAVCTISSALYVYNIVSPELVALRGEVKELKEKSRDIEMEQQTLLARPGSSDALAEDKHAL